jgi:hypothetical protein
MTGSRLEALLGEVAAPPLPAGLTERVAAAAVLAPQEARPGAARRAWTPRRDRRGAWLRRPLVGGAIALGLAFSGAVAATLAGVPLPEKVAAVMAQIPFVGHKAAEPEQHPAVRHAALRPPPRPARVEAAAAAPPPPAPLLQPAFQPRPAMVRRLALAERIVERRQAMDLPTPPVQQVQRMLMRRQMMRRWQSATPEQRQAFLASHPRAAAHIEALEARRAARLAEPGPMSGPTPGAGRMAEIRRTLRDATPEERQAFLAAHPRLRAMIEARRARRQAAFPPLAR